jgi:hypothetical protein
MIGSAAIASQKAKSFFSSSWFDRLTMRMSVLKTLGLIPSPSKDEAAMLFQQSASNVRHSPDL